MHRVVSQKKKRGTSTITIVFFVLGVTHLKPMLHVVNGQEKVPRFRFVSSWRTVRFYGSAIQDLFFNVLLNSHVTMCGQPHIATAVEHGLVDSKCQTYSIVKKSFM